jgi:hypothetical protein
VPRPACPDCARQQASGRFGVAVGHRLGLGAEYEEKPQGPEARTHCYMVFLAAVRPRPGSDRGHLDESFSAPSIFVHLASPAPAYSP